VKSSEINPANQNWRWLQRLLEQDKNKATFLGAIDNGGSGGRKAGPKKKAAWARKGQHARFTR